jgi:SulP family sulfate permease
VKDLLGLQLPPGAEPGELLRKLPVLWDSLPTLTPAAIALSVATIAVIAGLKKILPQWPGMLIAVAGAAAASALLHLPVATIGSQFGGIPASLPWPSVPEVSLAKVQAVLPSALSFALLGSIESLLSAVVADSMTGRRHRSNCELVAQGVANLASSIFGGICATGAIARTATNVRAGAHGPLASMFHSMFLLSFVLLAAPLASFIPLAALAGVLAVVAWNMVEKHAFAALLRGSRGDAVVLLATFSLTIFRGLAEAIVVGFALGSALFIHRMSRATAIATHTALVEEDRADAPPGARQAYDETISSDPNVVIYRISGAFFFGAEASIGSVLDRIAPTHRALIIDFSAVPLLDSTAANTLEAIARKAARHRVLVVLTGTTSEMRTELAAHRVEPPLVRFEKSIEAALTMRGLLRAAGAADAASPATPR